MSDRRLLSVLQTKPAWAVDLPSIILRVRREGLKSFTKSPHWFSYQITVVLCVVLNKLSNESKYFLKSNIYFPKETILQGYGDVVETEMRTWGVGKSFEYYSDLVERCKTLNRLFRLSFVYLSLHQQPPHWRQRGIMLSLTEASGNDGVWRTSLVLFQMEDPWQFLKS